MTVSQPATPPAGSLSKDPRTIRTMFGSIAPVYDRLNHVFSLNIDMLWRRYTARESLRPGDRRVLDVACGTGDLTMELRRQAPAGCEVFGADFCLPMLELAREKNAPPVLQGDGLRLPFQDETFDLATIAFGLRNVADVETALSEMRRVLAPGGRLAVLEFTTPANPLVRASYLLYFRHILPRIGDALSGGAAYSYLSGSVMEWPSPRELARIMRSCGYQNVRWSILSFGIAVLHIAERAEESDHG